jgi:hypothetical protein
MLHQELPLAYYQLLKMSEQERATLIGVQGKILITGDMNSLEVGERGSEGVREGKSGITSSDSDLTALCVWPPSNRPFPFIPLFVMSLSLVPAAAVHRLRLLQRVGALRRLHLPGLQQAVLDAPDSLHQQVTCMRMASAAFFPPTQPLAPHTANSTQTRCSLSLIHCLIPVLLSKLIPLFVDF